ncbi:MAG: hypothetical protein QE271_06215 [Bacteriovoracaceae bacterium]|nr:hypothetical protein [Bacteriovoracaceae bacterium]
MWSVKNKLFVFFILFLGLFSFSVFAQTIQIKREQYIPTELQLFVRCFEKFPLLIRSQTFKQQLQLLNENLATIDDNYLSYVMKGLVYRYLLEVPPEVSVSENLSPKEQLQIFDQSLKSQTTPCAFFDWAIKSLKVDLDGALKKSNSKIKVERASMNDIYEDKELHLTLKKMKFTLPWALYLKAHLQKSTLATSAQPLEAWEGHLVSMLKFLAMQTIIYRQYSSPSLSPTTTFEIEMPSDLAPPKTLPVTATPPNKDNPSKKIDELFQEQLKK